MLDIARMLLSLKLLQRLRRQKPSAALQLGQYIDIKHAAIHAGGKNIIGDGCKITGTLHLGYASTIGRHSCLFGAISIGKYCQIAPCVGMYSRNHPTSYLTSYTGSALFAGRLKENYVEGRIALGNDVWIGHGAIILSNVTIGDGAVVGAGAVVTRDIADYMVVAGNPARRIKMRFSDEIISHLKEARWWDRSPSELEAMEGYFTRCLADQPDMAAALAAAHAACPSTAPSGLIHR